MVYLFIKNILLCQQEFFSFINGGIFSAQKWQQMTQDQYKTPQLCYSWTTDYVFPEIALFIPKCELKNSTSAAKSRFLD